MFSILSGDIYSPLIEITKSLAYLFFFNKKYSWKHTMDSLKRFFFRSIILRVPFGSHVPMSPVWSHPSLSSDSAVFSSSFKYPLNKLGPLAQIYQKLFNLEKIKKILLIKISKTTYFSPVFMWIVTHFFNLLIYIREI